MLGCRNVVNVRLASLTSGLQGAVSGRIWGIWRKPNYSVSGRIWEKIFYHAQIEEEEEEGTQAKAWQKPNEN